MRTILFILLGWFGGYLLGSGLLKGILMVFSIHANDVPFVVLLLPYFSALAVAIVLPFIDQKNREV